MADSNGKWKLAFWVMAVVCFGGIGSLSAAMISTENRNVDAHSTLKNNFVESIDKLRLEMKQDLKEKSAEILAAIKEVKS